MSENTFDKVYVGSAEDAETAENAIAIANQVFDVPVKANNTGGTIAYDYLDKKTVFAFHSAEKDTWTEIQMTVSKTDGSVVMDPIAVTGITLNKTALTLEEGDEETLTAIVALNVTCNR